MSEKSRTLKVYVPDRFLWPLRIVVLLFALTYVHDIWVAINGGEIVSQRRVWTPEDGSNFNAAIWKKVAYALFFVFLAFGALRGESRLNRDEKPDKK